ncbi:NAD(P)/FAD-dependent oxidoreductase [Compostibacter hankyongensis]|uniref:NAD(P)/FAD-dependent oxidoreductase n=1 Tax=Compostibacter hankyongensis TaxID=1007089 RepID=A0ABP8FMU8_9BACT
MSNQDSFEVIILGGSYAGLSAAMSLGRALRRVLIIDSDKPCNRQTPHSHNFITQDGKAPAAITLSAREQVLAYDTVKFHHDLAVKGISGPDGFEIVTGSGRSFFAKKLLFATGIKDLMPDIDQFSACWGISVIHCPYCHGYEYRHEKTGILANGDSAFEMAKLISNWTKDLTVFTNGAPDFTPGQIEKLKSRNIPVVSTLVRGLEHTDGHLRSIIFEDGSQAAASALYARLPFEQHCDIPAQLGCVLSEQGYLKVDAMQKTTVPGIWACGDGTSPMRSVANAVYTGSFAGAVINKELIDESF